MAATERIFNAEESTLCEECSVLRIDDRELAIHQAQNHDGEDSPSFPSDGKSSRHWLDYDHCDLLPDLPYMRASAEAGCAFCAMLRSAALEKNIFVPAQVAIGLSYCWRFDEITRQWACQLQAIIRVDHGEGAGIFDCSGGNFDVDCKEGNIRYDVLDVLSDCTR